MKQSLFFDGIITGPDVPGLYEKGSAAEMGTSTGKHIVGIESESKISCCCVLLLSPPPPPSPAKHFFLSMHPRH